MTILTANRSLAILLTFLLLAVALAGAFFLLRDTGGGDEMPSFHFVARLAAAESENHVEDAEFDVVEAWYKRGEGSRWDLRYSDPALAWMSSSLFYDGKELITYDGRTNTYTRSKPINSKAEEYPAIFPSNRFLPGPLSAPDIETLITDWGHQDMTWEISGEEVMFNRPVQEVSVNSPGGTEMVLWIDPAAMFLMRRQSSGSSVTGGTTWARQRIESLEFDVELASETVRFQPPPAAIEVEYHGGPQSSATYAHFFGLDPPPGFRFPAYIPAGYTVRFVGSTELGYGGTTAYRLWLSGDTENQKLLISQHDRIGGLPGPIEGAEVVEVAGRDACRTTGDGTEILTWGADQRIVTLRSAALPFSELLQIAESMESP